MGSDFIFKRVIAYFKLSKFSTQCICGYNNGAVGKQGLWGPLVSMTGDHNINTGYCGGQIYIPLQVTGNICISGGGLTTRYSLVNQEDNQVCFFTELFYIFF